MIFSIIKRPLSKSFQLFHMIHIEFNKTMIFHSRFNHAQELYMLVKALADVVIPQEYGLSDQDKLAIGQGICNPLMRKIRADLQRNIEEDLPMSDESVNRLDPRYITYINTFDGFFYVC